MYIYSKEINTFLISLSLAFLDTPRTPYRSLSAILHLHVLQETSTLEHRVLDSD